MTSTQKRKGASLKQAKAKTQTNKSKAVAKSAGGNTRTTGTPALATLRKHAKTLGMRVVKDPKATIGAIA